MKGIGMKKIILLVASFIVGCHSAPPVNVPTGAQWSDATTIDDQHIDFIKEFHMQVKSDISMTVTSTYHPWIDHDCATYCSFTFEMEQGDDSKKWVTFDCDAVAEKIIQNDLVLIAEGDCALLRREAIDYWKENADPSDFTDSQGRVWKRQ